MIPGPDQLKGLRDKSAAHYACWVAFGLRRYLCERAGRHAFPGAEYFIGKTDSIAEDIGDIAKGLEEKDLVVFREGCVAAFRTLNLLKQEERLVAEEILRVCVWINAQAICAAIQERNADLKPSGDTQHIEYLSREVVRDLT